MVYEITATGVEMRLMNLSFEDVPHCQRWGRSMNDVREKSIVVPTLSVQSRVLYLVFTWVSLTEQFVRDWGNDFVPSDIANNIVVVREFLNQQPAPHSCILDLLQEIRVKGKSIAKYLQYYDGLIAEVHEVPVPSRYRSVVTWGER